MNREKLNSLLDSIYELEGLVHLALNRDDSPAALPELIVRKGRELSSLAEALTRDEDEGKPEMMPETDVTVSAPQEIPEAQPDHTAMGIHKPDPAEVVETVVPAAVVSDVAEVSGHAPEVASHAAPAAVVDPSPAPAVIPSESHVALVEERVHIVDPAPGAGRQVSTEPRGRLVFSINDRYRFKRELFDGSDAGFNNTLALVASMENYDEAEDYFLGELQWDQKKPEVIDFLEILKKYFRE